MEKYIFNEEENKAGYRGGFVGMDGLAKIAHLYIPVGLALDNTYNYVGGKAENTITKYKFEEYVHGTSIFDKLLNNVVSPMTNSKKNTRKNR
jgi:hypothetical protein